ncbi:Uncharacterized protein GBIM_08891 [Gryllus bimaculatus]|nr:Uncharacterized protein GBIM_08891 [Gryllus bimaculatus]
MSDDEADRGKRPAGDDSKKAPSTEPHGLVPKEEDKIRHPAPGASFIELRQYWARPDRPDEPGVLEPDHPLMQRFQQTLRAFLERQNLRLTEELRDLETDLKQATQARDDAGVRLYERQQEVSVQQRMLEKCHSELDHISSQRQQEDEDVEKIQKERNEFAEALAREEEQEAALSTSLQKLVAEERQFSEWAEEMRAELAVSQRAAAKDRQQIRTMAEEKRRQDALLYKLTAEVANLRDQMADLAGKLRIKEQERKEAGQAAADAGADIEVAQQLAKTAKDLQRDLDKLVERKRALEQESLETLSEQLRNDKLTQYLRRVAATLRDRTREQALLVVERGAEILAEMRREDDEAQRQVDAAEQELETITKTIAKRTASLVLLNNRLEALIAKLGGKFNPLEAKLTALTTDLRELEVEVQNAQAFWLRQQNNAVTLTQQRNDQINRLTRLRKDRRLG